MVPDDRADGSEIDGIDLFCKDDGVGNAGVHGVDGKPADILPVLPIPGSRYGASLERRLRHRDRRGELAVHIAHRHRDDSGPGLDRAGLSGVAGVISVLREAPDAVPAHGGLAFVGLHEPHPDIGVIGRLEKEDAVGTDTEPAIAVKRRKRSLHLFGNDLVLVLVDQDKVIAVSLQFGERDLHG